MDTTGVTRRRIIPIGSPVREEFYDDLNWDQPSYQDPSQQYVPNANYNVYPQHDAISKYEGQEEHYGYRTPPQQHNNYDSHWEAEMQPARQKYLPVTETPGGPKNRRRRDEFERLQRMANSRRRLFDRLDNPEEEDKHAHIPFDFKYIPTYVLIARRLNKAFFWDLIEDRRLYGNWCSFKDLPPKFRSQCQQIGVGPHSFEYLPGFAPKWVFALYDISQIWFDHVVDHFFDSQEMLSWDCLMEEHIEAFRAMNMGEFDYF